MLSKSDYIEIMINDIADEVFEKSFESLLNRYQITTEALQKGSGPIFSCVHLLYYKFHKIHFRQAGSYIHYYKYVR